MRSSSSREKEPVAVPVLPQEEELRSEPVVNAIPDRFKARRSCPYGDNCRRANPRHFIEESHPGDPDAFQQPAPAVPFVGLQEQLQSRDGSYDWIRTANDKQDRELRIAAAALTLLAIRAGGYQLDGAGLIKLAGLETMLQGTKLLTAKQVAAQLKDTSGKVPALVEAEQRTAFEAALAHGPNVAVLGAASAYHPCGGFRTGGRHALEESMCVQSTLSISLQRALWLSQHGTTPVPVPQRVLKSGEDWLCYIPDDGAVLSPSVEVFRAASSTGYEFFKQPQKVAAVVSVAMPNKNRAIRDSPVDAPADIEEYKALLRTKLKAALGAAALAGATAVVVPGIGCGVFQNDPSDVGEALAEAMLWQKLRGKIKQVVLAGVPPKLAAAARERLKSAS